jgi:uncharacterized protein YuzE
LKTRYDQSTDSLYIEPRPLPSVRTREIETDVFLDLGADGKPVGYDIQHASKKRDLVARLILSEDSQAA